MPTGRSVDLLVVTTSVDPHVGAVLSHLDDRVSVCRLDVDRFPAYQEVSIAIDGADFEVHVSDGSTTQRVDHPKVAWFRRFGKPGLPENLSPEYAVFARDEAEQVIQGLLDLVTPNHWVNEFRMARLAASKPYQYVQAARHGLDTAPALFTNAPGQLDRFFHDHPRSIVKSISRPLLTGTDAPQGRTFAYTNEIDMSSISTSDVRHVPSQFQPLIDGQFEVRVTSMFGQHVPVAIRTEDADPTRRDWRATQDTASYELTSLPDSVENALTHTLQSLSLQFAASDFIVDPSGAFRFLEANPHGAWLWLESSIANLDISKTFARHVLGMIRG